MNTYLQGGADEDEEKKKTRGKQLDPSTFLFRNNNSSFSSRNLVCRNGKLVVVVVECCLHVRVREMLRD